jgi:hypothetical protein
MIVELEPRNSCCPCLNEILFIFFRNIDVEEVYLGLSSNNYLFKKTIVEASEFHL